MSGGDRQLRSYLGGHRKLAFDLNTRSRHDALLHSFVAGETPCKRGVAYQPVDHDSLLQRAREARQGDREALARVESISKKGRLSREAGLLRAHREVWERERARLLEERQKVQEDLEEWRGEVGSNGGQFWREFLDDAAALESQLHAERQEFFEQTVQPLWTLKVELKGVLERHKKEGGRGGGGEGEEERRVLSGELEAVQRHQQRIQELLGEAFELLWSEVAEVRGPESKAHKDEGDWERLCCNDRDIPPELAAEEEGVEAGTYDSALRELQLLDNHYRSALHSLNLQHQTQLNERDGGWTSGDAKRFHYITGQYPSSLMRRRTLLIDRLMRELPHKTRAEIVEHESWYCALAHYHQQKSTLIKTWKHNRAELVCRLVAMLREQRQLLEMRTLTSAAREEQKKKAEEMYRKVCIWREGREAAQRQQEAEWARERQRREEERRREEQKMTEHRERLKAKLEVYHCQRSEATERVREDGARREKELERARAREGRRGRERVGYRQQLLTERQQREDRARERALQAVRERERRLEQLRKTVEFNATCDPARVLKPTKALEMRLTSSADSQLEAQHPLFTLHGYHDDAVTSDPRFRVAAALRKAGLLDSVYARHLLSTVPPAHRPRPEQQSSLFK